MKQSKKQVPEKKDYHCHRADGKSVKNSGGSASVSTKDIIYFEYSDDSGVKFRGVKNSQNLEVLNKIIKGGFK